MLLKTFNNLLGVNDALYENFQELNWTHVKIFAVGVFHPSGTAV